MPAFDSVTGTLEASVRSVGTAMALASVGVYAHRRGFVDNAGKRTLAVLSQQITFPLFLFTKIVYCNQNWSDEPCPDVMRSLQDVWLLLVWPLYVVGVGLLVGAAVAHCTKTPKHQVAAVLAACSFGNSTGLPITLLTVVHSNFKASDLGRMDPTLFLSVYLLLYPVLQWGLGGWLLAPATATQDEDNMSESFRHHVLNDEEQEEYYRKHRKGLSSSDEGMYMTELDLVALHEREQERRASITESLAQSSAQSGGGNLPSSDLAMLSVLEPENENGSHEETYLRSSSLSDIHPFLPPRASDEQSATTANSRGACGTLQNIFDRCLQPPVLGAIAGIAVAITPARGIFVDLVDRDSDAPLQWLFDGLYSVGLTAVPINMMILGCNLSASQKIGRTTTMTAASMGVAESEDQEESSGLMNSQTMMGIIVGKMLIMPFIGCGTAWILKHFVLNIPDDVDASFYLVLMIVFLTPTANNVMVMVELSGSSAKEGIARVIALQYFVAPVMLSLTMTIAIGIASGWS